MVTQSHWPLLYRFQAVARFSIGRNLIFLSLTFAASQYFGFFSTVMESVGFQSASLKGPFTTMFSTRVHWVPCFSTTSFRTGL